VATLKPARHYRLTMAPLTALESGDPGRTKPGTSTPASTSYAATSSSSCDPGNSRAALDLPSGKFWASSVESESDEEIEGFLVTPTKDEVVEASARVGFAVQDLVHAEEELASMNKVATSRSSVDLRCPLSSKIVKATVQDKSLKQRGKPWQGALPKPRISPPKTLGDAVIKNLVIRLRGGQLLPKSFKMALPSTNQGTKEVSEYVSKEDQKEQ
jgi:hypothetical protein